MTKIEKGKPLVLPNGAVVLSNGDGGAEVLSADEHAEKIVVDGALSDMDDDIDIHAHRFERTLADVHAEPKEMNTSMVIAAYTMWGLDAYAISRQLNVTEDAIESIKQTDLYHRIYEELFEASRHIDAANVHGFIQAKALDAAKTVVKGLRSKSEDIKLSAAKDILDRGGYRPADRVEHVHKFEDELRIVHLKKDKQITIDIEV